MNLKITLNKHVLVISFVGLLMTGISNAQITENFNDISQLSGSGWFIQNNSTPVGSITWFQGTNVANAGPFDAYNGAANAYIAVNFNSTSSNGTISNWLVAPNLTIKNGDVVQFYTRTYAPTQYPDRLELRLSTNGASTNVGSGATAVGDFTTLLLSVNPLLTTSGFPTSWTQYTVTISGLSAPVSGRLAFRYFVTNGGSLGVNSDYIGIDNFVYTPYVCPTVTVSGSPAAGTAGTNYSESLSQTGALGAPSFAITAGALPPGLSLSSSGVINGTPTATGTFNFSATASDASGCTGSSAFSISIACPTGGASLTAFPTVCDNAGPYTLIEGVPAGGTYSGTGVSAGVFDLTSGTQTISYDLIDVFGCAQTTSATFTVNTAPSVSLSSFAAVCDNGGVVTLSGGSPAGGSYSGTGVTGGDFDPSNGTQSITYSYTDANGCSNSDVQTLTVNTSPVVALSAFADVCDNSGLVSLSGGSPAGGSYSGTGVTGGDFDPSAGTQSITYAYTDTNGCSNSDVQTITVNTAPTVTLASFTAVCDNNGTVTLSGGSPAGGSYSGTGVTAGDFDPSAGTQSITYSYTDSNGCSNSEVQTFTVNTAPAVTLSSFAAVCDNGGVVTLSGGSPAGGTYSGTGVTAGDFDPASGTQPITYTFTDANGCSDSDVQTITVNVAPTVTLAALADVCDTDLPFALSGGLPAGGTYSGTGVTAGVFNPASGTQSITYTFTDVNGCAGVDTQVQTVNSCVGLNTIQGTALSLTCFPNPTNSTFTLHFNMELSSKVQVRIFSMDGKVVFQNEKERFTGEFIEMISLSGLTPGVYTVEVVNVEGKFARKITLQ